MRPIILLHGIFGFDRIRLGPVTLDYFGQIRTALAGAGHPVLTPGAPPIATVEQRAEQIKARALPWLADRGNQRAIVIAHSMGGLDARYMISRLGMGRHIAALLTIATPHRGSALADFWVENPPMKRIGLPLLSWCGIDGRGGNDLTIAAARRFNDEAPDSPEVRYFSISAACPADRVPLPLKLGYEIVRRKEGENDSMVSVASAQWGEHLATWPIHHLHQINHRFPVGDQSPVGDVSPLYLEAISRVEAEIR